MSTCRQINDLIDAARAADKPIRYILLGEKTFWDMVAEIEPILKQNGEFDEADARQVIIQDGYLSYNGYKVLRVGNRTRFMEIA